MQLIWLNNKSTYSVFQHIRLSVDATSREPHKQQCHIINLPRGIEKEVIYKNYDLITQFCTLWSKTEQK